MPDLGTMGEMPEMVTINGVSGWLMPSDKFYPMIAGGDSEGAGTETKPPAGDAGDKSGGTQDGDEFDRDRAMATIKKLRENEKATKAQLAKLADLEKQLAEYQQRDMSEKDKAEAAKTAAEKERDEARAEARRLKVERAIERAATKKGMDPELAASLLKVDSLEVDANGNPTGIDEALDELLKKWPHLKPETKPAAPNVNATDGKNKGEVDPKAREAELRSRFRIGK